MTALFSLLDKLPTKWAHLSKKALVITLGISFSILAVVFAYATFKHMISGDYQLAGMFSILVAIFLAAVGSLYHFYSNLIHSKK